jgi:hypothetical protein
MHQEILRLGLVRVGQTVAVLKQAHFEERQRRAGLIVP